MFCKNCGNQLPDNAAFCSNCGANIGAAPSAQPTHAAPAQPTQMPLIFKRLFEQVINFFVRKNPVGVVANSSRDTSWSGSIVAALGVLIISLANMVNVNQFIKSTVKNAYGKLVDDSYITKMFPSGASFLWTLLTTVVLFVSAAALVLLVVKGLAKKQITICGAINVVAYAALPMIGVAILNMIFGLIWLVLPIIFMIGASIFTVILIIMSVNKITDSQKTLTTNFVIAMGITVVAILFTYLSTKGIIKSIGDNMSTIIMGILSGFAK